MKPKQLLVLGAILVVLAIGVAVNALRRPPELTRELYTPLHLLLNLDEVQKILIAKGETPFVELKRAAKGWILPGLWQARADSTKVERLLEAVRTAKGELRADDKALLDDFGITAEQAFQIAFQNGAGDELLKLHIGSKKPDYRSVFLRKKGSSRVYLVDENLLGDIGLYGNVSERKPKAEFWAEMTILPDLVPEEVKAIELWRFKKGKASKVVHLVRTAPLEGKDEGWRFVEEKEGSKVDTEKVKDFLQSLASWQAQEVVAPETGGDVWEVIDWKALLTLEEGHLILMAKAPEEKEKEVTYFLLRASGRKPVFQVSQYSLEDFDLEADDFVASLSVSGVKS